VRKLVELVMRDPYGKIAALAIAIVLYLYLGTIATGVTKKQMLVVRAGNSWISWEENRIEIEEPPDMIVMIERGKRVEARLEGPQNRIEQLSLKPLVGRVRAEFFRPWSREVGPARQGVEIQASDIEWNVPGAHDLVRLSERTIEVTLARKDRRVIAVEPQTSGTPAPGYQVRSVLASPSRVEVEGPADQLRLSRILLAPVSVEDQSASFTMHGRSADVPLQKGLTLTEDVMVVVEIEPASARREIEVPLALLVPAAFAAELGGDDAILRCVEPEGGRRTVRLSCEGPSQLLERLGPETVRAFVDLADWPNDAATEASLPVQAVGLPEGCTFAPQQVTIVRRPAAASGGGAQRGGGAGG
jgi:hypothetical protein